MKQIFTMTLVEDPTGLGRSPGAVTKPDEPVERIFFFWFKLVPTEFLGTPEHRAKTTDHRLKVVVAANRLGTWDLYDANRQKDLVKEAFWIGKSELEKRMEKGELQPEEAVLVHTQNYGNQCPYDPANIEEPVAGAVFEIEVERRIGFN